MNQSTEQPTELNLSSKGHFKYLPFFNSKQPILIIILIGVIAYINTLNNEYALDDGILIHQNEFVIKGAKEIGNIFTHDVYHSFYKRMNATDQLTGGRYRPLGIATFALEQELIGTYRTGYYQSCMDLNGNGILDNDKVTYSSSNQQTEKNFEFNEFIDKNNDGVAQTNECFNCWDLNKNGNNEIEEDLNNDGVFNEVDCQNYGAGFRHLNNCIIYILLCLAIYAFLKNYIFNTTPDIAFLAVILFLIHPIHTEVVANVRGRDDLLSLLFCCLTLNYSLKYTHSKSILDVLLAGLCFLLALFSKEYAIMLITLIPITLYVFATNKKTLPLYVCLGLVFLIYAGMHTLSVNIIPDNDDTEVLNNPFVYANGEQKWTTKIYLLLIYLKQSVFPYPLISDYSFDSISLRNIASWDFWLSLIINLILLVIGYGLLVYFLFILPISNLIFPTHILLLEANVFHASLGICILLSYLFFQVLAYFKLGESKSRIIIISTLFILSCICLPIIINRNTDWKNDVTLFLKDVEKQPRSVLILGNAGARWIDLADTKEITGKALPGQENKAYNDYNGTLKITDEDLKFFHAETKRQAALKKGINYLDTAVKLHPRYVNGYLNLGLAHFKLKDDQACIKNWKMAEHLYPDNPYLASYYQVYCQILIDKTKAKLQEKKYKEAEQYLKYALFINPTNENALSIKNKWSMLIN
jgi:tetratricopeptide (TPR) repeat protein